ncbi:uncharacterized protein B0H18DRAFT_1118334 [Fomitopsis serialis]|uniref:uncharacterized protein n=1 Tax=Fomitopsis serialis TaxID=139415 RepID=UPI002007D729|nr:uncharacterized protein B0H18DRAFT_1118334 [Neoantrodia serialis]KAH9927814.1 hypothetical protein B0H18DRAFT_1118334 [Neoantrodia serialis]
MSTTSIRPDEDVQRAQESRVTSKDRSRTSSYRCVSWSYPGRRPQRPSRIPVFKPLLAGSGVFARPPHYHDLLYRARRRKTPDSIEDDVELSSRLAGVKLVEDTVSRYENDVGILTDASTADERPLFCGTLSQDDIATVQRQWHDHVEQLLGGISKRLSTSFEEIVAAAGGPDGKIWDLSLLDSPELSESELSAESDPPPSTPRASPSSLPRGAKHGSMDVLQPHPTPLSATAAAFIPAAPSPSSFSKSPSPTHEFAFPSLSADNPAASPAARKRSLLLKDGEGFYHSAEASIENIRSSTPRRARPSADLLPAFLADGSSTTRIRARNASRTREMVDRLRSGRWNGKKGSDKASPPSLEHMPEGKPTKERSEERAASSERSSVSSGMTADADGWISGPSSKASDDGWIDGPAPCSTPAPAPTPAVATPKKDSRPRTQKHTHKRSSSSASSLSTAASAPPATPVQSSLPVPAPMSAQAGFYPVPAATPLVNGFPYALPPRTPGMSDAQYLMHIQKLQHDHWTSYMRFGGAGTFVPGPYAAYPPAPAMPMVYGAK